MFLGGLAATIVVLALPRSMPFAVRALCGWNAWATVILALIGHLVLSADGEETRCRAAASDPGRRAAWMVLALGSAVSLFAAVGIMRRARELLPEHTMLLTLGCLYAVTLAWTLTHASFALRYAHLFYRDDDVGVGGLTFPGESAPDLGDFAYFAFTLGMTFQVSDVAITARQIRRTALVHALLSFAYNTAILALVLNLVMAQLG